MKIILNEQTKPYVKTYYVNKYLNNIECNNLDVNKHKENIEKLVVDTINEFLQIENNLNFPEEISHKYEKYVIENNIKRLRVSDIFLLTKSNPKYIKNLYKNYENLMIYQIYNSIEKVGEGEIEKAKEMLKSYFDSIDINKIDDFENFLHLMSGVMVNIFFKLGIKTKNAMVRNEQIAVKEGSLTAKENAKKNFKILYLNKIDEYESLLSKEKLKIYIEKNIDDLVENYFNNRLNSKLVNYLSSQLDRYLKVLNSDIILIKYARVTNNDDDYNYAIDYYQKKYEYILDGYNKNFGVIEKYKKLIEEYVKKAHLNGGIESYLKIRLNEYEKEIASKSIKFNIDWARNGNEIERQRHRHILLTEFEYKIASYKENLKFYDEEKVVDEELRKIYVGVIDSYINGVSNNSANRYLSTLLKQRFESYSKRTTKGSKYIYNILLIVLSYLETLEEYYNTHDLSYTKKGNIEEYMGLIFNEYIENGCYKEDHKAYFRKMIENYENIDKSYVYEK